MSDFSYTFKDGTDITVAEFKAPFGLIRKIRKHSESEQGFELIEGLLSEDQLAVIDEQSADEVNDFVTAWSEAASSGEKSAGADS